MSASTADEHSITYERILLLKFPKKSLSTATPDYDNNRRQLTSVNHSETVLLQYGAKLKQTLWSQHALGNNGS
jgi:hypothetical protein